MNFVSLESQCFVSGNIEILGKQNSLFPSGPVIKCLMFIYLIVVALYNSPKGYVTQNCHAFIIPT